MSVDTRAALRELAKPLSQKLKHARAPRRVQRYCAINADSVADKIGGDVQNL
jgi:hypothetical protein